MVKSRAKKKPGSNKKASVWRAVKGAVLALIVTVSAVLIFALIVKQGNVDDAVISAVNQIIKVACIFLAAFIATRKLVDNKLIAGALAGAFYVLAGFATFSLIEGSFGSITVLLADLAMGIVIGMLTAAIFGRVGKGNTAKA